ncbi:TetR/AcrR family transcriptional regulator [Clostridium algidicarnis]|uniref:TetR/AcrR family transcriptional regulator n=1 Tax=Clostridium algidicarnis TaxID=37659 RepID=A0ABS6C4D5_9CLOT|nr:TetR/AcrR family transcriptional regulator [Clostridium algidicarnis]MBU3220362.1 TetR/AcrR family transcriptional regulator [Clostridium algidicarnis]
MDRRQQKTRDAIFEAFSSLLYSKRYTTITVQEIIDKANVGRSTFYSHFETKDELLKVMCTDLFEHVFSDNPGSENTHDFSLADGNPDSIITHLLYHLRDNNKNIIGLLTCESSDMFLRLFKQYLDELIVTHMLDNLDRKNTYIPDDFLINHISGSFVEMVHWWIKNKMQQSPEELTKYFLAVINPIF